MSAVVVINKRNNVSENDPYAYNIQYAQSNQTKKKSIIPPEAQVNKRMTVIPPEAPVYKRNSLMPPDARVNQRDSIRNSPIEEPNYYEPPKRNSVRPPDFPIYFDEKQSIRNSGIRPEFYPSPVPPDSARMPSIRQSMQARQSMQRRQTLYNRSNQVSPRSNFNRNDEIDDDQKLAKPKEIRQVAGFVKQIRLLAWKNLLLSIRNIGAFILEILAPILVIGILVLIRYFASVFSYPAQSNSLANVFDLFSPTTDSPIILYYPNNNFVRNIVTNAVSIIQSNVPSFNPNITASTVSNGSLLDSNTLSNLSVFIAFPYTYNASLPKAVQYTIYSQETSTYQYHIDLTLFSKISYMFFNSPQYYCFQTNFFQLYNTFDAYKLAIDMTIISTLSSVTLTNPDIVQIAQFDCPSYLDDKLKAGFAFIVPIIISVAYLFTSFITVSYIIEEKQLKMKDYLKLIGVKAHAIWFTWFLRMFSMFLIISVIISSIGLISLPASTFSYLTNLTNNGTPTTQQLFLQTNFGLTFITFIVYSVQVSGFTILVSQMFTTPFNAKIAIIFVWIGTAINYYDYLQYSYIKYIFCIFPNCGLIFALEVIFQYERSSISFDFSQLYSNLFSDTLNLGIVLTSMFAATIIYIPITLYIERIVYGENGVPLPFYFPFIPSYWCKSKSPDVYPVPRNVNVGNFEEDPRDLNISVSLRNLTKIFPNNPKSDDPCVVKDISINFFENQLTAILGQDGAGKTTTTLMLCGAYKPTSGTGIVLGHDILNEINNVRAYIGYCPEKNILFDDLTVEEHLKLMSSIKNPLYEYKIQTEITMLTKSMSLYSELQTKVSNLSMGQKRRLSLAIALIGDSKVLILDEPTSGLDSANRKNICDLIRKYKKNRTIIMTTNFIEEADLLSDRTAIIYNGEVKCCGSPMFLKNAYGLGYRLSLSKTENFNKFALKSLMEKNVGFHKIETSSASEIKLSLISVDSPKIPKLLNELESAKEAIGITAFGISSPTLEEAYLKIDSIEQKKKEEENIDNFEIDEDAIIEELFSEKLDEEDLLDRVSLTQQVGGLFVKRALMFSQRFFFAIFIILIPAVGQFLVCYLTPSTTSLKYTINGGISTSGTQTLSISNYKPYTMPYAIYSNSSSLLSSFQTIFTAFYSSNRAGINLQQLSNDSLIAPYVLSAYASSTVSLANDYYTGISFNVVSSSLVYANVYYSTLAYHSPAAILNEVSNVLLAYYTNSTNSSYSITTYNTPISATSLSTTNFLDDLACIDIIPVAILSLITSILVAFCISILVIHVGKEKVDGSKNLQTLSGVHGLHYWLANHLFDLIILLIQSMFLVAIIILVAKLRNNIDLEISSFTDSLTVGVMFLLFFFSIFSWSSLAYVWSNLFNSESVGFVSLFIILCVASLMDTGLAFGQLYIGITGSNTIAQTTSNIVRWIFASFFPNVLIKRAMFAVKLRSSTFCVSALNTYLGTSYVSTEPIYSFNEPGLGIHFALSILQIILYCVVLVLIEKNVSCRACCSDDIDETDNPEIPAEKMSLFDNDVADEATRLQSSKLEDLSEKVPLIIHGLVVKIDKKDNKTKETKKVFAVDNLSFGILKSECFGLLGNNGAGKTTTFKYLTGEITNETKGVAYIDGNHISNDRIYASSSLGYCPQINSLPETLSVEQCLKLYSTIRGVESNKISSCIENMLIVFKLIQYRKYLIQNLSAANKRKLSIAIAFIGRPPVIILDEPTLGLDPTSKRSIWSVINKAKELGITILLTSNSMEECEALCSRIGIMVNGQLECLGNIQHVKSKFGSGYSLIIKLKRLEKGELDKQAAKLTEFLAKNVSGLELMESQQEIISYSIDSNYREAKSIQNISDVFRIINENKDILSIETYSISQTTLEDIFVGFSSFQQTDDIVVENVKETTKRIEKY